MSAEKLYHKANWMDGQVLTDPNSTLCHCCGRRMGFRFNQMHLGWDTGAFSFGCIGDPLQPSCPLDGADPCCDDPRCAITTNDIQSLAEYYVDTFLLLITKGDWRTISFIIVMDHVLLKMITIFRTRELPMRVVITRTPFTEMTVNRVTGNLEKYDADALAILVVATDPTALPKEGEPLENYLRVKS